jgi:hypothetical protein
MASRQSNLPDSLQDCMPAFKLAGFEASKPDSKQYGKTACLIAGLPASRFAGQLASLLSSQHLSGGISKSCRRFCGLYRIGFAGHIAISKTETQGLGNKVSYGESHGGRQVAAKCCVLAMRPS